MKMTELGKESASSNAAQKDYKPHDLKAETPQLT
jgi:hypothetical protein